MPTYSSWHTIASVRQCSLCRMLHRAMMVQLLHAQDASERVASGMLTSTTTRSEGGSMISHSPACICQAGTSLSSACFFHNSLEGLHRVGEECQATNLSFDDGMHVDPVHFPGRSKGKIMHGAQYA